MRAWRRVPACREGIAAPTSHPHRCSAWGWAEIFQTPGSSPLHPCLIAYFWAIMFDRENLFLSRADARTVSNL